jgi:hypothetical protein
VRDLNQKFISFKSKGDAPFVPKRVFSGLSAVNQGFAWQSSRVETGLWNAAAFHSLPTVRVVFWKSQIAPQRHPLFAGDGTLFPPLPHVFLELAFARGV